MDVAIYVVVGYMIENVCESLIREKYCYSQCCQLCKLKQIVRDLSEKVSIKLSVCGRIGYIEIHIELSYGSINTIV